MNFSDIYGQEVIVDSLKNAIKNKLEIVRKVDYIADFTYTDKEGKTFVVDCKGWKQVKDKKTGKLKWKCYQDDIYKLKKKIFLHKYPDLIFQET